MSFHFKKSRFRKVIYLVSENKKAHPHILFCWIMTAPLDVMTLSREPLSENKNLTSDCSENVTLFPWGLMPRCNHLQVQTRVTRVQLYIILLVCVDRKDYAWVTAKMRPIDLELAWCQIMDHAIPVKFREHRRDFNCGRIVLSLQACWHSFHKD